MRKFARFFIAFLGLGIGPAIVFLIFLLLQSFNIIIHDFNTLLVIYIASAIVCGMLMYIASAPIIRGITHAYRWIEKKLYEMPINDVIYGVMGLLVGLVISFFISQLINQIPIPVVPVVLSVLTYVGLSVLGWSFAVKRRSDILAAGLFKRAPKEGREERTERRSARDKDIVAKPKILDTSVIIDGRIFDICKTGFIEGALIIPGFVLQELRHIADSPDSLKRNRGRRGLDVLNRIRKELDTPVRIVEKDYDDLNEVDSKLLRMAQEMSGVVVTNDYNLNKVAEVQSVTVFNINELSNAVKPVLLPGEEMQAHIVKDGKESGQGVAYLDDGTMIVVEGGKRHIGEECTVVVTSVLQTAAGRMIFAKIK
ncbi:MAG: PIN/TRAM domain-containing protein [Bacillota bacterium]